MKLLVMQCSPACSHHKNVDLIRGYYFSSKNFKFIPCLMKYTPVCEWCYYFYPYFSKIQNVIKIHSSRTH